MDAHEQKPRERQEYSESQRSTGQSSKLAKKHKTFSSNSNRSSLDSYTSVEGEDADVDPTSEDMNGAGDAYRRRKAQLMAGYKNGRARVKDKSKRHRNRSGVEGEAYSSADAHDSEFSSLSTSDDVEMTHLASDGGASDDEETGLTKKDKRHRKRRRRRTTGLDARVGGNTAKSQKDWNAADRSVLKAMTINVMLIASWYFFSLSISIYNKWMFSPKYLDFHFPLFTTCMHMLVQFCLASLVLFFIPSLRPRSDSISNPHNHANLRSDSSEPQKPLMTRMFYLTRIGPCGAATGLDIGLGNMSLKFITLTFYTMCKSSSLAFVLSFAFLFRLETPSIKLIFIIATMTIGVIMMVAGEAAFDALGFILVISAAFFSGFRWSLTQILLLRSPATSNPFSSIFYLAPIMFLSLAIIAIPVEGFPELGLGLGALTEAKGTVLGLCILLFPGLLAFLMTASEFALLQRTSVVTLSICGIFKEVVTISAAGIVFHDPLTPINISGLLVTIASIAAYNYIKITKMRKEARAETEKAEEGSVTDGEANEPMLAPPKQRAGREASSAPGEDLTRTTSITASHKSPRELE